MFIEPGQCQNLTVIRSAGMRLIYLCIRRPNLIYMPIAVLDRFSRPVRADKLILQFLPCDKDVEDCKEFFKEADKNGVRPDTLRISLKMMGEGGNRIVPSREVTDDAIS
ncbi:unnamed protein product [Angiostrongylus costaricensis]|uniref:Pyruvate dehydrogenase E1 component subunit beta n=1 Tax=Angiostrongylus costaricensis TaxID=334426 RepID=A0A0R3PKQ0_ANGCS|nr:unnamed protein product [Angiostrongylus costaricensis]